jgi:hypothetical protein
MYYIYIILYICIIYILYYPFPKCAESTGNSPESSVLSGFQGSNRAGLGRLRRRGRGKRTAVSAEGQQLWRRNLPILYNYGYIHYTSLYWWLSIQDSNISFFVLVYISFTYYLGKFDHDLTVTSLESWFMLGKSSPKRPNYSG